jgi:hypothetical protein
MSGDVDPIQAADDGLEVISAFIDGERVDGHALRRALEAADGRDYLVDLLALREALADPHAPPAAASRPGPRRLGGVRPVAAAAVALLALAGGYLAGQQGVDRTAVGARSEPRAETVVMMPAPAAPTPTQVIKLEPGVDWVDKNGGE